MSERELVEAMLVGSSTEFLNPLISHGEGCSTRTCRSGLVVG